ncbi:MAG: hypothetical protein ACRD3E_14055, partial [Terriglobales bacterium]
PSVIPSAEREILTAELNHDRSTGVSPVTRKSAVYAKSQRRSPDGRSREADIEIAGFWGGGGSDRLHAGRFKVKLDAPVAAAVR